MVPNAGTILCMENVKRSLRAQRRTLEWLAAGVGLSRNTVKKWKRVPASHVVTVEGLTGVSRYDIRPDIFGPSPVSLPTGYGGATPDGCHTAPPGDFHAEE